MKAENQEGNMEKRMIKVTLNSNNPAEAELIKILESVKNKSAYLKMAAFHFCNILGKMAHGDESRDATGSNISKAGGNSDPVKTRKRALKKVDEMEFDFSKTFEELK
jgi:hypothetical protein